MTPSITQSQRRRDVPVCKPHGVCRTLKGSAPPSTLSSHWSNNQIANYGDLVVCAVQRVVRVVVSAANLVVRTPQPQIRGGQHRLQQVDVAAQHPRPVRALGRGRGRGLHRRGRLR